jgi:hypothetical protein
MIIETNARRDILFSVALFLAVILATTCAGIFGPPLLHEELTRKTLNSEAGKNVLTLRIPGVCPQNEFLIVKLTFELSNPMLEPSNHSVSFHYLLVFLDRDREVRREQASFSRNIVFEPRRDVSDEILFFFDRFISYDRIDLRLVVAEFGALTDAVIRWTTGEVGHLKFQFWIRTIFGLGSCAVIGLFWARLRDVPFASWPSSRRRQLF